MSQRPPHSVFKGLIAICLGAALLSAPATAQARSQSYLRDVIDLAETLGKAHAVRVLCNGNSDQYWRRHMVSLMELEAPGESGLRRSMINGFNAGYSTTLSEYRTCSRAALDAEKTYAGDGRALTNQLATANIPGARLLEPDSD